MLFGRPRKIEDAQEKLRKMEAFVERLYPGRWRELRPVTRQELKAVTVLGMPIEEASAKIRTGPPVDEDEDYALPIWAGVLNLGLRAGPIEDDPRLAPGTRRPDRLNSLAHLGIE
jgi:hypothetical protein